MDSKPLAVVALICSARSACDFDVEDPGELRAPDIDVQVREPGRIEVPEVEIRTPEITVEEREVKVPTVRVDPADESGD